MTALIASVFLMGNGSEWKKEKLLLLPVRTSFTMEGGDSELFANFTLPTLKAFLEARSHNVSGNKQYIVARAIGCPKTHFCSTYS